jgi:hypothetical protein
MYSMHSLNHFLEVSLRVEIHSLLISIPAASRYPCRSDDMTSLAFPAIIYTVYSYCISEALCSAQVSFLFPSAKTRALSAHGRSKHPLAQDHGNQAQSPHSYRRQTSDKTGTTHGGFPHDGRASHGKLQE